MCGLRCDNPLLNEYMMMMMMMMTMGDRGWIRATGRWIGTTRGRGWIGIVGGRIGAKGGWIGTRGGRARLGRSLMSLCSGRRASRTDKPVLEID